MLSNEPQPIEPIRGIDLIIDASKRHLESITGLSDLFKEIADQPDFGPTMGFIPFENEAGQKQAWNLANTLIKPEPGFSWKAFCQEDGSGSLEIVQVADDPPASPDQDVMVYGGLMGGGKNFKLNMLKAAMESCEGVQGAVVSGSTITVRATGINQPKELSAGYTVTLEEEIRMRAERRGMTLTDKEVEGIAKGLRAWPGNVSIDTFLDLIEPMPTAFRGNLDFVTPKPAPDLKVGERQSKHKGRARQPKKVRRKNSAPVIPNPGLRGQ